MPSKELELIEEARRHHQNSEFKKGMKSAQKARKGATKNEDFQTAIEALRIMADCALNVREMKKAEEYYSTLLKEAGPQGHKFYQSAACWGLGQLALHKMDYPEATNLFKQGLIFAQNISDGWYTAWNAFGLGTSYRGIGNLEKSKFNYQLAIDAFSSNDQKNFSDWVKRALSELNDDTSLSVETNLRMWLCPLCGSKFTLSQADILEKGKKVTCQYCGTSVG